LDLLGARLHLASSLRRKLSAPWAPKMRLGGPMMSASSWMQRISTPSNLASVSFTALLIMIGNARLVMGLPWGPAVDSHIFVKPVGLEEDRM